MALSTCMQAGRRMKSSVQRPACAANTRVIGKFPLSPQNNYTMAATLRTTTASSFASRRTAVVVRAQAWQKASTKDAIKSAGGKLVVELGGACRRFGRQGR